MRAVEWNKKEELVHDQALKHLKVWLNKWPNQNMYEINDYILACLLVLQLCLSGTGIILSDVIFQHQISTR